MIRREPYRRAVVRFRTAAGLAAAVVAGFARCSLCLARRCAISRACTRWRRRSTSSVDLPADLARHEVGDLATVVAAAFHDVGRDRTDLPAVDQAGSCEAARDLLRALPRDLGEALRRLDVASDRVSDHGFLRSFRAGAAGETGGYQ